MAGKYLDRDAVLKAVKEVMIHPDYAVGVVMRIEKGEFDATVPGRLETIGMAVAYGSDQERMVSEKIIAEKDAEIARLKEQIKTHKGLDEESHRRVMEILALRGQIVEMEKLCDMQKATIDTQGKALEDLQKVPGWVDNLHEYEEPVQKAPEPELFICPDVNECTVGDCRARIPHEWVPHVCDDPMNCSRWKTRSGPCIPTKSPVPTSGTGTAPASGTVSGVGGMTGADIERISQSGARILPPDKKDGHYPGMAKDIGDLKLLYDRLDRENDKQFVAIEKVERKFKELKGQYGDYNFGNRVKRLETALKALQEEVAGIKKNPILLLRDRTPATFTTTWENPIQYTQTTDSYNPCQNCQKLLLYRQQLAIGGGQTSAAMQNPCDNCPSRPGYTTTSLQPQ